MDFKIWLNEQEIIQVKDVRQSHNYDCGAAALKSIAKYYGVSLEKEADYIKLCQTGKRKGTHPDDIVNAALKLGLQADLKNQMSLEELKSFLDKKIPVICAIQAYGEKEDYNKTINGHYVIAIGYDEKNLFFEDPSLKQTRGFIPIEEFMKRWHDRESYSGKPQVQLGIIIQGKTEKPDTLNKVKKIV